MVRHRRKELRERQLVYGTIRNSHFQADLAYSHSQESFWNCHYHLRFPTMWKLEKEKTQLAQQAGVDRTVRTREHQRIFVEEKLSRHRFGLMALEIASGYYPGWIDGALYDPEFLTVVSAQNPGWMEKSLACDYIVFGYPKSDIAVWLDWSWFQQWWKWNRTSLANTCRFNSGSKAFPRLFETFTDDSDFSPGYLSLVMVAPVAFLSDGTEQFYRNPSLTDACITDGRDGTMKGIREGEFDYLRAEGEWDRLIEDEKRVDRSTPWNASGPVHKEEAHGLPHSST